MLSKILNILKSPVSLKQDQKGEEASEELKIATAVLLLSVAGADSDFDPVEVRKTFSLVADNFGLEKAEAMQVLTKAEHKLKKANDIEQEVELVNESYNEGQRQLIFSLAWKVVCSDGKIENHERKYASKLRIKLELSREQAEQAKYKAM